MSGETSSHLSGDRDDPPPYSPDPNEITKFQNESDEGKEDNINKTRNCSICHYKLSAVELVYFCEKCHKSGKEVFIPFASTSNNVVDKNKEKEPKKHNETLDVKSEGKAAKFNLCQRCRDGGELCPNDNGDGNHVFQSWKKRGKKQLYMYYPTVITPSDSVVVKFIKTGNTTALKELGSNIKYLNTRDKEGYPPLHIAINLDSEEMVKALVEMGAFIEARNDFGFSPLMVALDCQSPSMITTLLDLGADPNGKGGKFSPLHKAAAIGNEETLLALLSKKPDIDVIYDGMTPLMFAFALKLTETARILLDAGANPNLVTNGPGNKLGPITPLTQVVLSDFVDIAKFLVKYGIDVEAKHRFTKISEQKNMWETSLTLAAAMNSVGVLAVLLDAGADINAPSWNGRTALAKAAAYGKVDAVKLLLERKADVNKKGDGGWSPLTDAASKGHLEIVRLLVENGAVGDPKPYWSWKSFKFGVKMNSETKKEILELGRSVKHKMKKK